MPVDESPQDPASPRPAVIARPDPEVAATPTRRRFTAENKLRILKLADACTPLCQDRCRAGFSQIWGREMRDARGNEFEIFTRV
jgi:hypothetical protein